MAKSKSRHFLLHKMLSRYSNKGMYKVDFRKMISSISYEYTIKHLKFCIKLNNKQLDITKLVVMVFL